MAKFIKNICVAAGGGMRIYMNEVKNHDQDQKQNDLKADREKSTNYDKASPQKEVPELFGGQRARDISNMNKSKEAKKKRIPIVVDIIVAILMVAIILGVVVGAYLLFRYYSGDYAGVDVKYALICVCDEDPSAYMTANNRELYLDSGNTAILFGKITDVRVIESGNNDSDDIVVLTVSVNAKYKKGEGYTIEENRIAVGRSYTLRSEGLRITGTIAELETEGGR